MNILKFHSWASLRETIEELRDTGNELLFRGQSNVRWKLESTIFRFFESQFVPQTDRIDRENQAERFFLDYLNNSPDLRINLTHRSQVLMLMQHYGCPTRMLDWSKSPYVAAFFAIQDLSEAGAIFAINLTKYQSFVAENVVLDDYEGDILQIIPKRVFGHLERVGITFPIPLVPDPITERESEQQTAFLIDMQLDNSLETCFLGETDEYLWKFEFGREIRPSISRDLLSMNIDGRHMFPGLGGVALCAKEHLLR